jgi:GNAT superfamily N-acetyltransferase
MQNSEIEACIVDHWDPEEILSLYRAAGWWKEGSDTSIIPILIKQSYAFVVAVHTKTKRAVGMGRVLSDGISDAYIQDVVVLDEWRGKGVGTLIINTLIRQCLDHRITWIALISEPHQEGFYVPLGFKKMNEYTPMKYKNVN